MRHVKASTDDFLRRSREITSEIVEPSHSNSRGWAFANSWEKFTLESVCSRCGKGAHLWRTTCNGSACQGEIVERTIGGRENWLVAPLDLSKNFIAAPYAWGESVPLANLRVLREEAEEGESWAIFATSGHTTGGGYLTFDSSDEAIVELLAEFESALGFCPILDSEAHFEVEREMWAEAIGDWLVDDFKRDVVHSDEMRSICEDELTTLILDSVAYLENVIEAILWGHLGYVSADDIHYDKGAVSSFASGIARFVDSMGWAGLERELTAEEVVAEFEAHEFQFLADIGAGYVDYYAARELRAEFRAKGEL